jgi:hypothetical protein
MFRIQDGLKQGVFLPLHSNFALEHIKRKIQENQVWLKLNWIYQLLVYADDVSLLGDNIDIVTYLECVTYRRVLD